MRILSALLLITLTAAGAGADEIELGFLKGDFSDLGSELQPIDSGGLKITVSSPEHRLTVHGNRLSLSRNRRGNLDVALEVALEGEGKLIADVEGPGIENRFLDEVSVPLQNARGTGEIRLEPGEEGYLITVVRAGPAVRLSITSSLAGQIVGLCRALSFLPLVGAGCDSLEQSLSTVSIPMPDAGERFVLPASYLTAAERDFLDGYLRP